MMAMQNKATEGQLSGLYVPSLQPLKLQRMYSQFHSSLSPSGPDREWVNKLRLSDLAEIVIRLVLILGRSQCNARKSHSACSCSQ